MPRTRSPSGEVIAETDMCWVTAPVDATLPGYVCVSTKRHAVEPYDLDDDARDTFFAEAMAVPASVRKPWWPHGARRTSW